MPLRVAFRSLGCKLNQLETESCADAFARGGAVVLPSDAEDSVRADLIVVNTCTVTHKADRSSRRILRQALAANPDSVVLVTGCYAQVEAEALAAMDDRILVLPGADKSALLGLPARLAHAGGADLLSCLRACLASTTAPAPDGSPGLPGRFDYNPSYFAFHSRPALKIQDGCDNDCAYCRVRLARGPAASLGSGEALARVRALDGFAQNRGQSLAQMAIAWVLRDPRVTSALIGAHSVAQLDDSLKALDNLAFTVEELAAIDQHATEGGVDLWRSQSRLL